MNPYRLSSRYTTDKIASRHVATVASSASKQRVITVATRGCWGKTKGWQVRSPPASPGSSGSWDARPLPVANNNEQRRRRKRTKTPIARAFISESRLFLRSSLDSRRRPGFVHYWRSYLWLVLSQEKPSSFFLSFSVFFFFHFVIAPRRDLYAYVATSRAEIRKYTRERTQYRAGNIESRQRLLINKRDAREHTCHRTVSSAITAGANGVARLQDRCKDRNTVIT